MINWYEQIDDSIEIEHKEYIINQPVSDNISTSK